MAFGVKGGWLVAILALSACSEPSDKYAPAEVPSAGDQGKIETRVVSVTLREGTNMAVTVNAKQDRVISLQGQLFFLPADGEGDAAAARAITSPYYDAREPQYSPQHEQVVFHGYRNGNWDIWQVATDGESAPQTLTNDAYDDREPQYLADSSAVVFSSDRGGSYDIWQVNVSGDGLHQLTDTENNVYSPTSSVTGKLAYAESQGGESSVVVHPDRVLVTHAGVISGVQWSPDESQISYQLIDASRAAVRVVDLNSGNDKLVSVAGSDVFPFRAHWLTDDEIAYTADGKIKKSKLVGEAEDWPFSVSLDLTRHDYPRRKRNYDSNISRRALGISSPVISAGGEDIYFSALGDIWQWRPSNNSLNKLIDDSFAEHSLALSPDGSMLAYVGERTGRIALHLFDLASYEDRVLNIDAEQVSFPSFSPNGENIAFFVDVIGNPLGGQLMVMNLDSGEIRKVLTPMPGQPISWSEDGRRVAVTRLNAYSSRYREGMYELVITDISSNATSTILPVPHKSISSAVLTADGAMTYVQSGLLHRLELDANYTALEDGGLLTKELTNELTDLPSWSSDGDYLVYLSGDRLKRLDAITGKIEDVTPEIEWNMAAPQETYVLRVGRLFTGEGDDYLLDRDIWISGDRIQKVVAQSAVTDVPVVNASEYAVYPGLFEMHAHMGATSEVQGRVWLSFGITSVRDPGANPYTAKERQEAWDSGRRVGPRTYITGYLTDGNRVYYAMAEGIVSEEHLQKALDRTAALQLDFIKTYVRLPDHWQRKVVDFAHNIGIPVSSHELYPAVAHGMDHVEHIGGTSRRGYQPKVSRLGYSYDDVFTLLSQSGMGMTATAVLPGFAVIMAEEPDWFETQQFDTFYGPEARRYYEMLMPRFGANAAAIATANGKLLRELTRRDALLVTGTDAPFVPYGAGLHAEFRLYRRAGLTPAQILHQATMKSAQAAGVASELGSIVAGKLADIVVVNGDPLANIGDADNVVMTIKNGQLYPIEELLVAPTY